MRALIAVIMCFYISCATTPQTEATERTIPEPLFSKELPEPPAEVPPDKRMAVSVSECTIEGSDPPQKTPPGILMSQEMTMRAARLKVAYDEMRGLYEVDLQTMDREREVYERHLKAADDEIADWKQKARRSWWENNKGTVGLVVGVVTGAALTIGIAAAIDQATE
jgi:hypothetical protein